VKTSLGNRYTVHCIYCHQWMEFMHLCNEMLKSYREAQRTWAYVGAKADGQV